MNLTKVIFEHHPVVAPDIDTVHHASLAQKFLGESGRLEQFQGSGIYSQGFGIGIRAIELVDDPGFDVMIG